MSKKNKGRKIKHIPMRTCIVTQEKKPKKDLIRLVKTKEGVKVDLKGKEKGRGANISIDLEIFDQAIQKHLIEKSLKLNNNLKEEEISVLRETFKSAIEEKKFRKGKKHIILRVHKNGTKKIIK